MADPCTCSLGADECEDGFGVFGPLGHGGSCAVRPCRKPVPERCDGQYVHYRNSSGGFTTAGPFNDDEARLQKIKLALSHNML